VATFATSGAAFVTFETGQVRPIAFNPSQTRLFAINTPDNQLEIFDVNAGTGALTHAGSVPVGLEPIAVAARTDTEVWVVNHLSDSISIVDAGATPPRVVRTLLVGDEPRDIVFADPPGATGVRAFITTAHRGQNTPFQRRSRRSSRRPASAAPTCGCSIRRRSARPSRERRSPS
jgi:DNA-binding beta-propeller fold protein YncE